MKDQLVLKQNEIDTVTKRRNDCVNPLQRKHLNRVLNELRHEREKLRSLIALEFLPKPERNPMSALPEIHHRINCFLETNAPEVMMARESLIKIKEQLEGVRYGQPLPQAQPQYFFNQPIEIELVNCVKALSINYANVVKLIDVCIARNVSPDFLETISNNVDSLYNKVVKQLFNTELLKQTVETFEIYEKLLNMFIQKDTSSDKAPDFSTSSTNFDHSLGIG